MIKALDFGFLFSRVAHFYSIEPLKLKKYPLRMFWLLSKNVDRLRAEEDLRMMKTMLSTQSGELIQKHSDSLLKQMGKIVEYDEGKLALQEAMKERDRDGLMALKGMGRMT